MANDLYAKGKQRILDKQIGFLADDIKVVLLGATYTPDLAADEFLSQISGHALADPLALASRAIAGGVFDAADVTFPKVASGSTAKAAAIYKDTGVAETSPLLAYIDTISGFPFATNGSDVIVQWDNGTYKVFSL